MSKKIASYFGYRKLFLIGLMFCIALFLTNLTSAVTSTKFIEDTDKRIELETNTKYGTYEIADYKWWDLLKIWTEDKIVDKTLLENTDYCLVDCFASGKSTLYKDGILFDKMDFYNEKNSKENIDYKIYLIVDEEYFEDIPYYEKVCYMPKDNGTKGIELKEECYDEIAGYTKESKIRQVEQEYNYGYLKAGEYNWIIRAKKQPNQNIDWIGTINGVELKNWAWWNGGWAKKKEVTIYTADATSRGSVSVLLNVSYEADMKSDFSDLRFINTEENTELGYWFYNNTYFSSNSVRVWVKLDRNISSASNITIYMYYGNSGASSNSNISNAGLFGDDFNSAGVDFTNKWQSAEQDKYSISSNRLAMVKPSSSNSKLSTKIIFTNYIAEARVLSDSTANENLYFSFTDNDPSTYRGYDIINIQNAKARIILNQNLQSSGTISANVYYIFKGTIIDGGTSDMRASEDNGNLIYNRTGTISLTGSKYPALYNLATGTTNYVDWVYIRSYVSSEPLAIFSSEIFGKGIAVTLSNPLNNTLSGTTSNYFNWTITPTMLKINNWTLQVRNSAGTLVASEYSTETATTEIVRFSTENIPDGNNTWNVYACSNATTNPCAWATANYTLRVDTANPTIGAVLNQTQVTWGDYLKIYSNITDANPDSCWYVYNSVLTSMDCGLNKEAVFQTVAGQYQITIYANDTVGNQNSLGLAFNEGLLVLPISPTDASTSTNQIVNFSVNISEINPDNVVGVKNVSLIISVGNETSSSGIYGSYSFIKNLTDGAYSYYFQAYGNNDERYSSGVRTLNVNTTPMIEFSEIPVVIPGSFVIPPTLPNGTTILENKINVIVIVTSEHPKNLTHYLYYNGALNRTVFVDNIQSSPYLYNQTYILNADGFYSVKATTCTTTNQCNSTETRYYNVDYNKPIIEIVSGSGFFPYADSTTNHTISFIANDLNLDTCIVTYNSTQTVFSPCISGETNNATFNVVGKIYNATITVNDTFGNTNTSLVNWNYRLFYISETYSSPVYETASNPFTINLDYNVSRDGVFVKLNYGGINYTASESPFGTFSILADAPIVNTEANYSFNWFVTIQSLINSSDNPLIQTASRNQTILPISISLCSGNNQTLNFTSYDEQELTKLEGYSFFGTFNYWTGTGLIKKNLSISQTNINETVICINPVTQYYADATIQYLKDGFVSRNYYLYNASLTNTTQNIKLYLLNNSAATAFIIQIRDKSQLAVPNAYLYAQRYYPGTNVYETISMGKTDANGNTVLYFQTDTEDYRIIVFKDGEVIYTSERAKIYCNSNPCVLLLQIEEGAILGWQNFGNISNLYFEGPYYDLATNNIVYTYIDSSGTTSYGRLYVWYFDKSVKTTICNITTTSSAATLTCNVSSIEGTVYAEGYLSRSPEVLVWARQFIINSIRAIMGQEGLFWATIIIAILSIAGVLMGGVAGGIIGVIIGLWGVSLLGIAQFGAITTWGVSIVGLFLLWNLKR